MKQDNEKTKLTPEQKEFAQALGELLAADYLRNQDNNDREDENERPKISKRKTK